MRYFIVPMLTGFGVFIDYDFPPLAVCTTYTAAEAAMRLLSL